MEYIQRFMVDSDSVDPLDPKTTGCNFGTLEQFDLQPKFKMATIGSEKFTIVTITSFPDQIQVRL